MLSTVPLRWGLLSTALLLLSLLGPGGAAPTPAPARSPTTDGSCASGTTAHVEARKTPSSRRRVEQAAEALERKQQRLETEATAAEQDARRAAEQDSRSRAARNAAAPPQPQDYARSPECARSRRNPDLVASGLSRSTHEQELRLEAAQRQVDMDCSGPPGLWPRGNSPRQPARVAGCPAAPLFPPPAPPRRPGWCSAATGAAPTTRATPTRASKPGALSDRAACADPTADKRLLNTGQNWL